MAFLRERTRIRPFTESRDNSVCLVRERCAEIDKAKEKEKKGTKEKEREEPDMTSRAVFIIAAKRTPFGKYGGKLKGVSATDMCRVAATSALKAAKVSPEVVDSVIVGNVVQVKYEVE